ncbi:hypothetical protein KDW_35310 [Dictyobacter vulcani]|uniref:Thiamine pyrophosphate enzyme N-terminal TPP-binding domain-containing protein n=1 Tax=Dictyobacter vulcani TaxID=2607529 RepID=A0A5J4KTI9_9CHLR|nr:thiamine pyrophosphate-binding protein [Dictyobacter vulcani]GER89369.1 hypothetical protein KDW_35310 [Dictyobacter vulcani]
MVIATKDIQQTGMAYQTGQHGDEVRELTGSEIICEVLQHEGVDLMYGYPGGAIMPFYDAITSYPALHHVLVRHEQAAAHAADGYARATGKVGVCVATSGPGATNLVTGLATAFMDSIPLLAITGQVARNFIGRDAFQETDILGVTQPITKHNFLVRNVEELAATCMRLSVSRAVAAPVLSWLMCQRMCSSPGPLIVRLTIRPPLNIWMRS